MKSPKGSAPTFPTTAAARPSWTSVLAVLSAQPPPWSEISSTSSEAPRGGTSSTGRAIASAQGSLGRRRRSRQQDDVHSVRAMDADHQALLDVALLLDR